MADRCSCYDKDCMEVKDPLRCWFGTRGNIGVADGYCPLLRSKGSKAKAHINRRIHQSAKQ